VAGRRRVKPKAFRALHSTGRYPSETQMHTRKRGGTVVSLRRPIRATPSVSRATRRFPQRAHRPVVDNWLKVPNRLVSLPSPATSPSVSVRLRPPNAPKTPSLEHSGRWATSGSEAGAPQPVDNAVDPFCVLRVGCVRRSRQDRPIRRGTPASRSSTPSPQLGWHGGSEQFMRGHGTGD
jgi:hypothetical protein